MSFTVINPYTEETVRAYPTWDEPGIESALAACAQATPAWAALPIAERAAIVRSAAAVLRRHKAEWARLITVEMGKRIGEAEAEIEKCAWCCEFYAEQGPRFLADEPIETDAMRSLVAYQPLGTVLAIMPWNFPFWQAIRFAAPALVAGNTGLLKHASNVPGCALALEQLFREAGAPDGVFTTLMIRASQVERVIADRRVHAVTLTGSEGAGRQVAQAAGAHLKKTVLELGGSDAFVVLEDCDLEAAAAGAVQSRFLNAGQSCIAAKRFVVVEAIADRFVEAFRRGAEALRHGDPLDPATTLAPLCRGDQRDELDGQVRDALAHGARLVTGGRALDGRGYFYAPTILDGVRPGMRVYHEEVFGPAALVLRAKDESEAIRLANDSPYGLGGSVWTGDPARGERVARALACGAAFVNGIVKSDPRLPFGGVKASGYGRELSHHGIREFCNAKTVWVGAPRATVAAGAREQGAHAE